MNAQFAEAVTYKISDMDRQAKPYDLVVWSKAYPMVAIWWVKERNKKFYLIKPETINELMENDVKSITEEDACKICEMVAYLK